eukprot:GHVO01018119.1.p1 GENE.GHVO01018119.1~~GHVO01018119.1.p1  ORF type:complete len:125 (+),score=16.02 GHVO01018119.1:26-376(+)
MDAIFILGRRSGTDTDTPDVSQQFEKALADANAPLHDQSLSVCIDDPLLISGPMYIPLLPLPPRRTRMIQWTCIANRPGTLVLPTGMIRVRSTDDSDLPSQYQYCMGQIKAITVFP